MKKIITTFKPMSRLGISLLFALPCGMLFCSSTALATEYDQVSDQIMTYDTACDASQGCYQVVTSDDNVLATSSLVYVIGQDSEGKSIETYSESYIDGKLVSKQETDYSLSQRLLENRTYAGNDQHIIAIKDYDYDVYERTAQEVVKNYEDTGAVYQTNVLVHHYDAFNTSKETQSELTSDKPGDYKSYKTKYDVFGRAISRSYELDGRQYKTSSQYDGSDRGVLGSDFNANVNASVYDENGHLAQTVSYQGSSITAPNDNLQASDDTQVIDYEYDNYSRLIEHSLNGHVLGYDFDKIGLESGFSITNAVSNGGNLTASVNSENISYDEYNRIKTYNDYNNITYTVYYKEDGEVDHISMSSGTSNLSGRLSSDKYDYDSSVPYWLKGQVHTQTIDVNQNGHHQVNVITRGYYAPDEVNDEVNIGKLKYVWYQVSQDGKSIEDLTVQYGYDDQGRISIESYLSHANPSDTTDDHSENNLNKVIHYTYDPLNRLVGSETLFISANKQAGDLNKQVESYSYNINGDVTKHVTTRVSQDGSQKVINNTYAYNEINQLLTRSESIKEDGQITSQIQYAYGYDQNGNTITIDETKDGTTKRLYEYKYNSLNQMIGFTDVQKHQGYVYTYYPDGRRSSKSVTSDITTKTTKSRAITESIGFLYGHQGNLLNEEYSQDSQLQKRSSYFAGLRFIDDLINKNDSVFQFPLADQHNHPATVSFSQGQSKIESYHLTDYGHLEQANLNASNIDGTESQTEKAHSTEPENQNLINFMINPKVYGSGYYDPESNLQYMGARYYSADTQRFMAQDSYNLLNRYNYANGNPVMNYDPDGHISFSDVGKSFIPQGSSGWAAFNASTATDLIFTGIASQTSLPLVVTGMIVGGLSNGIGTMVAEIATGDKLNALDITAQVTLGIVIGGAIGYAGTKMMKSKGISSLPEDGPQNSPNIMSENETSPAQPLPGSYENSTSYSNIQEHWEYRSRQDEFRHYGVSEGQVMHGENVQAWTTEAEDGHSSFIQHVEFTPFNHPESSYAFAETFKNNRPELYNKRNGYAKYCPLCKKNIAEGDVIVNIGRMSEGMRETTVLYNAKTNRMRISKPLSLTDDRNLDPEIAISYMGRDGTR